MNILIHARDHVVHAELQYTAVVKTSLFLLLFNMRSGEIYYGIKNRDRERHQPAAVQLKYT